MTLDEAVARVQAMLRRRGKAVNGRTSSASATAARSRSRQDAQHVIASTTGVVGFFGASSMERLPTEVAMTENMQRFKDLRIEEAG